MALESPESYSGPTPLDDGGADRWSRSSRLGGDHKAGPLSLLDRDRKARCESLCKQSEVKTMHHDPMPSSVCQLLAVSMLLASPALAQMSEPYIVRDTAAPCLRIRPAPSTDSQAFACIPPGTAVTVLGVAPFWREIRLPDTRQGWAAKKFLEPSPAPSLAGVPPTLPTDAFLEVHFVDVGQGDAVWVRTQDDGVDGNGVFEGRNLIIDGGPNSADSSNMLLQYLQDRAHHEATIDVLILTHPHNDHYNGADTIFRHFEVANYYDPGFDRGGVSYPAYLARVRAETINGQPASIMLGREEFEPINLGSEVSAEILYSYPGDPVGLGSGGTLVNGASIVLRIEYGEYSFLFMGDLEGKERHEQADAPNLPRFGERMLLSSHPPEELRSTVLKIAHHGSESSSTQAFIDAVQPERIVVTSGRASFSGTFLPDETTLQRYCCANPNARIYRTDHNDEVDALKSATDADGDHVVVRTNGSTIFEVTQFSGGLPVAVDSCQPACPLN